MTASPPLSDLVSTGPVASRRGLSIRWHLTLFGIAVVVPVLIVAIAAAVHVASVERARTQDDALQIARNIADDIDRELDSTVAVLQALAFAPILLNGNFAAFDGLARQIANLRGADIGVRDLSGKQFINTRVAYGTPLPQNADPELRRADVMAAQTKRPVVSNLFAGNSGPSLIIDVPVLSDGEPVYILSMRFSPERIHKALTARELPISVITAVADGNYRLIARSVDSAKYLGADSTAGFRIGSKAIEGKWEGTDRTGVRISGAMPPPSLLIGALASPCPLLCSKRRFADPCSSLPVWAPPACRFHFSWLCFWASECPARSGR